jgi:DNA-binding NarL/FixJ family response regulator
MALAHLGICQKLLNKDVFMFDNHQTFYIEPTSTHTPPPLRSFTGFARQGFESVNIFELSQALTWDQPHLLLLDFQTAIEHDKLLENIFVEYRNCQTIIVNAPDKVVTSDLVKLGHMKGFFYQTDACDTVWSGIKGIVDGQYMIPQAIAHQLLKYYQSVMVRHSEPHFTNLTQREIEVLQSLKDGVSNNKLADELFVSEHTIKSHLYKIFKKLDVKNRNQAIAWAHKFLP